MTLAQEINSLRQVTGELGSSSKFASDLVRAYDRYGCLTPKQTPWVGKLLARVSNASVVPSTSLQLSDFSGVVELFTTAKKHLKFPKVRLLLDGEPIILSVAGPHSKSPGTINIVGEGQYPNRAWYGRVTAAGLWEPSGTVSVTALDALVTLLNALAGDPYKVAAHYGKLTGHCCFCGLKLTDVRSTGVGFGPVCAEHYGLENQWNSATQFLG